MQKDTEPTEHDRKKSVIHGENLALADRLCSAQSYYPQTDLLASLSASYKKAQTITKEKETAKMKELKRIEDENVAMLRRIDDTMGNCYDIFSLKKGLGDLYQQIQLVKKAKDKQKMALVAELERQNVALAQRLACVSGSSTHLGNKTSKTKSKLLYRPTNSGLQAKKSSKSRKELILAINNENDDLIERVKDTRSAYQPSFPEIPLDNNLNKKDQQTNTSATLWKWEF